MSISLRKHVTRLERRQFGFWLSAALFGGAVPELLLMFGKRYLWLVWVIAAAGAGVLWWRDRRRDGIGVLVSLPQVPGIDQTDGLVKQIDTFMGSNHRGWFRAGPEDSKIARVPNSRAHWAIETIRHRLLELDARSSDSSVFLYLHCRQEESFHLGRASAAVWTKGAKLLAGASSRATPRLAVKVRYISTYDQRTKAEYYEIDLTQEYVDGVPAGNVDTVDLRPRLPEGAPPPRRLALAVLASDEDGNVTPFKQSVMEAVTGGDDHSYAVGSDDFCDRLLVISISPDALIEALKKGRAARFIHFIDKQWRLHAADWYGSDDVEVLLFIKGPSIIAFAAGALLPESSRLIAWTQRPTGRVADEATPDAHYLAIIDGDDVGAGMERHLLRNELEMATDYSSAVSAHVTDTVEALSAVPGVELISNAGDSAIFRVESGERHVFEQRIEALRAANKDFRFSCGIGEDARSAFANLRLAKASGKNISR